MTASFARVRARRSQDRVGNKFREASRRRAAERHKYRSDAERRNEGCGSWQRSYRNREVRSGLFAARRDEFYRGKQGTGLRLRRGGSVNNCAEIRARVLSFIERGTGLDQGDGEFSPVGPGDRGAGLGGIILFAWQHLRAASGCSGQPSDGVQDSEQDETFLGCGVPSSSIQFHSLLLIWSMRNVSRVLCDMAGGSGTTNLTNLTNERRDWNRVEPLAEVVVGSFHFSKCIELAQFYV